MKTKNPWLWFLLSIAGVITIAIILQAFFDFNIDLNLAIEKFTSGSVANEAITTEERVIALYRSILFRTPDAKELVDDVRNVNSGKWTLAGLRQRLIDSPEHQRLTKMQTNELTPELQKVVSDKELINFITIIYFDERKHQMPDYMILPLRDAYILFEYNEFTFRAMLRHKNYGLVEEDVDRDVKGNNQMTQDEFEALLIKHIGSIDSIKAEGEKLAEQQLKDDASKAENDRALRFGVNWGSANASSGTVQRTVSDTDSDMTPMLNDIVNRSDRAFCKDDAAKLLDKLHEETYNIPVKLHYGEMVLRPEMSWSVPQPAPPVCTTLGQKPLIQPVMTDSKLLLGTPLNETTQEGVGSIMPKFVYKEYVSIPTKECPTDKKATATKKTQDK